MPLAKESPNIGGWLMLLINNWNLALHPECTSFIRRPPPTGWGLDEHLMGGIHWIYHKQVPCHSGCTNSTPTSRKNGYNFRASLLYKYRIIRIPHLHQYESFPRGTYIVLLKAQMVSHFLVDENAWTLKMILLSVLYHIINKRWKDEFCKFLRNAIWQHQTLEK